MRTPRRQKPPKPMRSELRCATTIPWASPVTIGKKFPLRRRRARNSADNRTANKVVWVFLVPERAIRDSHHQRKSRTNVDLPCSYVLWHRKISAAGTRETPAFFQF